MNRLTLLDFRIFYACETFTFNWLNLFIWFEFWMHQNVYTFTIEVNSIHSKVINFKPIKWSEFSSSSWKYSNQFELNAILLCLQTIVHKPIESNSAYYLVVHFCCCQWFRITDGGWTAEINGVILYWITAHGERVVCLYISIIVVSFTRFLSVYKFAIKR